VPYVDKRRSLRRFLSSLDKGTRHTHLRNNHLNPNVFCILNTMSSYAPSTSSLIPSPAPKDYSSALASLQTRYGFGGAPLVASTPNTTSRSRRDGDSGQQKTAPKLQSPSDVRSSSRVPKNYSAALAQLQSTYGFGVAPALPTGRSSSSSKKTQA
jgi:hypothetical protein